MLVFAAGLESGRRRLPATSASYAAAHPAGELTSDSPSCSIRLAPTYRHQALRTFLRHCGFESLRGGSTVSGYLWGRNVESRNRAYQRTGSTSPQAHKCLKVLYQISHHYYARSTTGNAEAVCA